MWNVLLLSVRQASSMSAFTGFRCFHFVTFGCFFHSFFSLSLFLFLLSGGLLTLWHFSFSFLKLYLSIFSICVTNGH